MPFGSFFRKKEDPQDNRPTAFPILYSGKGIYSRNLNADFAVVFEDDGETGYFYATDNSNSAIFDALYLYDRRVTIPVKPGDEVFIVCSPSKLKAGIFYNSQFQAVFDFSAAVGACRTGFPPSNGNWSKCGHTWDESLIDGLQPGKSSWAS